MAGSINVYYARIHPYELKVEHYSTYNNAILTKEQFLMKEQYFYVKKDVTKEDIFTVVAVKRYA